MNYFDNRLDTTWVELKLAEKLVSELLFCAKGVWVLQKEATCQQAATKELEAETHKGMRADLGGTGLVVPHLRSGEYRGAA